MIKKPKDLRYDAAALSLFAACIGGNAIAPTESELHTRALAATCANCRAGSAIRA